MQLYFITGNENKLKEIREMMGFELEQLDVDLPEIQEIDSKKIIEEKLKQAAKHYDGKFIVEDTSLHIDGLNGLPGPLIKWFLSSLGLEGIYNITKNSGNMRARAKTMIGYYDGENMHFVEGSTEGEIIKPRGRSSFGWDPLFLPDGCSKSYEEMTPEEKNEVSHRGKAIRKFRELLIDD